MSASATQGGHKKKSHGKNIKACPTLHRAAINTQKVSLNVNRHSSYKTAQKSSDNLHSYPLTNFIAQLLWLAGVRAYDLRIVNHGHKISL